ncbi:hypothetical protein T265_12414, partial [Opisthorchis viverrini]
ILVSSVQPATLSLCGSIVTSICCDCFRILGLIAEQNMKRRAWSEAQMHSYGKQDQFYQSDAINLNETIPANQPPCDIRGWAITFVRRLYRQAWFRLVYMICILSCSFVSMFLSWMIFRDAVLQQPGLVYDRTPLFILVILFILNTAEMIFFGIDVAVWVNTLWNEPDAWFFVDIANVLNIFLSEIPIGIMNAYLSACHESTVSVSILVKASTLVCYILVRFLTFTTVYLLESTDDGYVDVERFINSESENESENGTKQDILARQLENTPKPQCFDVLNTLKLRRFWLLIRVFIILGFFIMLVTNILIFKFTFVQTYRGHLEWRRVTPNSNGTLEDTMAERYFHDVEIFLRETEFPTNKWLHLVSLEKLIGLQNRGIVEHIALNYLKSKSQMYAVFSQLIKYPNSTTETSMTCWNVVDIDKFKEKACSDIFTPNGNAQEVIRLKSLKIQFTYVPPSSTRHLGAVFYNASRTDKSGKIFQDISLTMKYFQNTIAHNLARSKGLSEDDAARNHDGWTSGPFRPLDLFLTEGGIYSKYDLSSGDLIPVRNIWKTGFAMCPSTAPDGPLRLSTLVD